MSRAQSVWQPFNFQTVKGIEHGSFVAVARPDGKAWIGIIHNSKAEGVAIRNANQITELHYTLNPTASIAVLSVPKWNIGFGQPRLPL